MATASNARTGDEYDDGLIDDLFEYDIDDNDLGDLDISIPDPAPLPDLLTPATQSKDYKKKKDDLGLDNEVEIKARRITVKLDGQRLLSNKGLPRLRKEAPSKLKFKGKGYEYKDAARLLSYYQLWADDLFKKAKFRDTLQIIEKLGHTRIIRAQREEWIQEFRDKKGQEDMRGFHGQTNVGEGTDSSAPKSAGETAGGGLTNEDDLYSLPTGHPAPRKNGESSNSSSHVTNRNSLFLGEMSDDSDEEMNDFDNANFEAVLNAEKEKAIQDKISGKALAILAPRDDFEDELEAMEAMGAFGEIRKAPAALPTLPRDDFEDEMEAMEAMGTMD